MRSDTEPAPILVYDATHPFWAYWVRYWQRLTGDAVRYEAYEPALSHPEAPPAICWVDPAGARLEGAAAACRLLAGVPEGGLWWWLYLHGPGFAPLARLICRITDRHGRGALALARFLWGEERHPDRCALVTRLFLALLALIYLAAFASLAVQITGLVGTEGILPVSDSLARALAQQGESAYLETPTLFWLDASDSALRLACGLGMAAASALLLNVRPFVALLLCYVLYLSLVHAGQRFLAFQWDWLLLESGFLALFLGGGSHIVIWLYRWLLFRFMFMGGVVKLASGDPGWRDLSALKSHLESQPLPSPVAWYAYQLPDWILQLATASVLVIELGVPFSVLLPRRPRRWAACCFLLLQGTILLTGNFAFFNLLTLALCVFLLDDRDLARWLPAEFVRRLRETAPRPGPAARRWAGAMAVLVLTVCGGLLWLTNARQPPPQPLLGLVRIAASFGLVNGYGPFAVVSKERNEIVLEGSEDRIHWLEYGFPYKPGDPARPLGWNVPHQPRLDWLMWFAVLDPAREREWFCAMLSRLRGHSEPVLNLLADNPFPARPPRFLRASLYRYRYSSPAERVREGAVWQRLRVGDYLAGSGQPGSDCCPMTGGEFKWMLQSIREPGP